MQNERNCHALLRFRSSPKDKDLKKHPRLLSKCTVPFTKTQNEIISASNDGILRKLVGMMNSAHCFTVLVYKSTDISTITVVGWYPICV